MAEWIISSCALILVVLGLRALLKDRISQRLRYALWALVLLRLLVSVNFFELDLSVQNSAPAQAIAQVQTQAQKPITYVNYELPEIEAPVVDVNLPKEEQQIKYEQAMTGYNEAIEKAKEETGEPITLTQILTAVWIAGAAVTALVLLVCNLRFGRQLRKDREKTDIPCELPVYTTGVVSTPCLFGPAIYLPAGEAGNLVLDHVLAHEMGHYRQLDHVWSLLRCVCLSLHWYNPLVWVCASLSKKDAELACDEATIKALGEDQRLAYGRTLIEMTCAKREPRDLLLTATTMSLGKKTLKERVTMIAKHPKTAVYTLVALILVMSLAVGCTFSSVGGGDDTTAPPETTGPMEENTVPEETTAPEETTVPQDTVPVAVQPLPQGYGLDDLVTTYQEDLAWSDDFGNDWTSTFSIPVIYPFSEEAVAVQAQIQSKYMALLEENRGNKEEKYAPRYFSIAYTASLENGTLSIIISESGPNDSVISESYTLDMSLATLTDSADPALVARFQDLLSFNYDSNWYNQAMTHVFNSPEELWLSEFFYNGFPEESNEPTPEENAFLHNCWSASNWLEVEGNLELDLVRLPADRMDQILRQYFGIGLADTSGYGLEQLTYWDDTDCYYSAHGDNNAVFEFTVDLVTLSSDGNYQVRYSVDGGAESYVITLKPNGDGYLIVSNLPA